MTTNFDALYAAINTAAERQDAARAIYDALEDSEEPDHDALKVAQDALGDAVAAEDAAIAAYRAAQALVDAELTS